MLMYLLNIIAASLPTYFKHKDNPGFASVGASGAVSGLVFIFVVIAPWTSLSFLFIPILKIPAIVLGIGYLIYSSIAAKRSSSRIDHVAHFYGALFGVAFLWITKPIMFNHFINSFMNGLPFNF